VIASLRVTLQPTTTGEGTYIQIMSDDMFVNVVLVAGQVELIDQREADPKAFASRKPKKPETTEQRRRRYERDADRERDK
jgi:hypothetical protein